MTSDEHTYVVTCQHATSVTQSLTGQFTGPDELNLIVGKASRLEVFRAVDDGLDPVLEVGLYGRITSMELFRAHGMQQDVLFIVSDHCLFCVLEYDAAQGTLVTRANGSLVSLGGRASRERIGVIDPRCRVIGVHLYEGLLQIIPLRADGSLTNEASLLQLKELHVHSMCFMHDSAVVTLATLYQDPRGARWIKLYRVNLVDKELEEVPTGASSASSASSSAPTSAAPAPSSSSSSPSSSASSSALRTAPKNVTRGVQVESTASRLIAIPGPCCGVVVVGDQGLTYLDQNLGGRVAARFPQDQCAITAHGMIDDKRILLGDSRGTLMLALLRHDGQRVLSVDLEVMGPASTCASAISYLDNSFVFIGSKYGDSVLVKLLPEAVEDDGSHVELQSVVYNSLAPIVDMTVVDLERKGQGQLVTCSGRGTEGSLRVIRNGIAVSEIASVPMPGIQGMWSLKESRASSFDQWLVISFVAETRVRVMTDDELGEITIPGFDHESRTLHCSNVVDKAVVQVTPEGVRLVSTATLELVHEWKPKDGARINVARSNDEHVLLATAGKHMVLLRVADDSGSLSVVATQQMDEEVACLDICTSGSDAPWQLAAVGMWVDTTVRLLSLPSLTEVCRETLGANTLTRSIAISKFGPSSTTHHLLCGRGDGYLATFVINQAMGEYTLASQRTYPLGTQPVLLTPYASSAHSSDGLYAEEEEDDDGDAEMVDRQSGAAAAITTLSVFAACDRPTIIHGGARRDDQLLFSNVNLRDVSSMCTFNCAEFPNSLVFAQGEDMLIGDIEDESQRLHIRTVHLDEQPRRIAHQWSTNTFLCSTIQIDQTTRPRETVHGDNFLRLLDEQTLEVLDSFGLQNSEHVTRVLSIPVPKPVSGVVGGSSSSSMQGSSMGAGGGAAGTGGDGDDDGDGDVSMASAGGTSPASASASASEPRHYFVVGTGFTSWQEKEPKRGRLLLFDARGKQLRLVSQADVRGAAWCLEAFQGKILASVNSELRLFSLEPEDDWGNSHSLSLQVRYKGHIFIQQIKVSGQYIIVGDLLRSMSVLMYQEATNQIVQVARDFESSWISTVGALATDKFIAADNSFNFITLRKAAAGVQDEEERNARLARVGKYHVGEFVNVIREGSLVMQLADSNEMIKSTHLFGTVSGAVGALAPLTSEQFVFLDKLQSALNQVVHGVGGWSHAEWRAFKTPDRTEPAANYIDGDLIEQFLDLDQSKQVQVAKLVGDGVTVEEIAHRVDDLSRIH